MTGPKPIAESLACVTGRFQPVHADHVRLFRLALEAAGRLVVAVTNPDPGTYRAEPDSSHRHLPEANPFTYFERLELLTAALRSDEVNLRAGPGTRYPIDWVYKRRDQPVEILREFEVWRLVQDPDGIKEEFKRHKEEKKKDDKK